MEMRGSTGDGKIGIMEEGAIVDESLGGPVLYVDDEYKPVTVEVE